MSKNKIFYISHRLQIGGVEIGIRSLLSSEHRKNKNFTVIAIGGVDRSFLPSSMQVISVSSFSDAYRAVSLIQSEDILVTSLWKSHFFGLVVSLVKKVTLIPFIHNERFKHIFDRFFSVLALIKAKKVFVDSRATKLFVENLNFKSKDIRVINFNFDEEIFKTERSRQLKRFVYIGRLAKQKNVPYLIDLIGKISSEEDIKLDIFGPTTGEIEMEIFSKYPFVKYCGILLPDDVSNKLAQYDAFIQSPKNEGMCIILTQALKQNLVCFTTAVGEIPSYFQEGLHGFFLEGNNLIKDKNTVISSIKSCKEDYNFLNNSSKPFNLGKTFPESFWSNLEN